MTGINKTVSAENAATLPLAGTELTRIVQSGNSAKCTVQDIANLAPNPLTTKGDITVFGIAPSRLPVGANDLQLIADNTQTLGVKWYDAIGALSTKLATYLGATLIGFLQSGVGAVLRTMASKSSDIVSVFDYMTNAQILDVRAGTLTIDCVAAINAANTYLAGRPSGGTLYFPCGTYLTLSGVSIPDGVSWQGETPGWVYGSAQNRGAIIYKKHTQDAVTVPVTTSGMYIDGIGIVGRGTVDVGGSGFVLQKAIASVLRRCVVEHVYLHSFVIGDGTADAYTNTLEDCYSNNPQTGSNFVINSTLFRGHKLISDGGLWGITFSAAATNWSMGEGHHEGWSVGGMHAANSLGITYGKTYLAGTNVTGLTGVLCDGSASGIKLVGIVAALANVRQSGSIGLSIAGNAVSITLRDSSVSNFEIAVKDSTAGTPAATMLVNNLLAGSTTGIYAASQGSQYLSNTFTGSVTYDVNHQAGANGLWRGNRMSLTGNAAFNPGVTGQGGNFSGNCVKENAGYVTRSNGYASSFASGTTLTHGLAVAPLMNGSNVAIQPNNAGFTISPYWTTPTSTTVVVTWTGTSPNNFTWEAHLSCDF